MLDAMNIAATGMRTQQLNVDTIANNLANVNTGGFKKSRVTSSTSSRTAPMLPRRPRPAALPCLDSMPRSVRAPAWP